MNKVLLISMEDGVRGTAIRYLSSWLKFNGISASLLFLRKPRGTYMHQEKETEEEIDAVIKFIIDNGFSHIGFSIMTPHFYRAKALSQQIKKHRENIIILWGQIHPSIMPEECLEGGADIVVIRDGEVPLKKILTGHNLSEIKGIGYHKGDALCIQQPSEENFLDLDTLPFPDHDFDNAFVLDKGKILPVTIDYYRKNTMWEGTYHYLTTSRGCPYQCSYCCNINKDRIRRRSVGNIMEELRYIKKKLPFVRGINIQDDSFFLGSDAWLEEFSVKLKTEFGFPFIARIMPRLVTEKRIKMLKDNGLRFVDIGLQGSDRLNSEYYNRHETAQRFIEACTILARYGLGYAVDVLIDNPYERKEDIIEITKTLNAIPKPYKLLCYGLTLFPGTELKRRVEKEGFSECFGTDPYTSTLSASLPGKYKTPEHWRRLILSTPLVSKKIIEKVLEIDIATEEAEKRINNIYAKARFKAFAIERLRKKNVVLFEMALTIVLYLRRLLLKLRLFLAHTSK
ncbi:MAG: radical SAM protein [Candidatus Omnitrophica bacterium]|nr:radical SAM protein [Candidatus Omnitrophota bacterium]